MKPLVNIIRYCFNCGSEINLKEPYFHLEVIKQGIFGFVVKGNTSFYCSSECLIESDSSGKLPKIDKTGR